jgi:hypothetical protein
MTTRILESCDVYAKVASEGGAHQVPRVVLCCCGAVVGGVPLGSFNLKQEKIIPLTLTPSEGPLPQGTEKQAFARLYAAMLKGHGFASNKVMTPNVVAFSGSKDGAVTVIEGKIPSFAFNTRETQRGNFAEATDTSHEMSGGDSSKERIRISVVHAVDGAWDTGGRAMTKAQFGEVISLG